jgi:DNA repair exonuclease SbcCD nuclease subunit
MKFLYCSDLHGKVKNPVSRLDNYVDSWLLKIKEINQLAITQRCSCVIVNGDVFDTPHISNVLIDDFLDIIEQDRVIWKIVVGNHDLVGANWANSQASALAHIFRRSQFVQMLDVIETEDTYIKGINYYCGIEEDLNKEGVFNSLPEKTTILIPHALITLKPFFKNVSQVLAENLKTNYDMILCGHLHTEFDKILNNVRFINLNSIGRTSINERHDPEVAIIDTNKLDIQKIALKSTKPSSEIFDLSRYNELKKEEKSIEDFINSLKSINFQGMELGSQIVKVGKENKVEQKVVDYLLEKIK